jgi:FMN-dependent oxidoreductase (nitrilotriacetate monooxygenase family)
MAPTPRATEEVNGGARREMKLGAFLYPTGYHIAAWRHPEVPADAGINFAHCAEFAAKAEQGKFDFVFLADSLGVRGTDIPALSRGAHRYVAQFEPLTLISALAALTRRIGLVASATTTYYQPYHLARMFASLDHVSGGRSGWNLVTSQNECEAYNFGLDAHPPHEVRYARAREFVDVVRGLWDSWEDDAFPRDKASGVYFDPGKLHVLGHKGRHFSVRGPLNVPRAPQGHPVMVQAGASDAGRELAAETSEIVFTAQDTLANAQEFYRDVKARVRRYGRSPDDVKIMVGVFPFVGRTTEEAREKFERLQSLIDPVVGLSLLSGQLGEVDLSAYPLDGPLPELPETNASKSRRQLLIDMAKREHLTIRQLCIRVAGSRGHWQVVGDAARVADELECWFHGGAADGFNIMAPYLPGGLDDVVEWLLPELRRRGLFRHDYDGHTLRHHLGLRRPANGFAVNGRAHALAAAAR